MADLLKSTYKKNVFKKSVGRTFVVEIEVKMKWLTGTLETRESQLTSFQSTGESFKKSNNSTKKWTKSKGLRTSLMRPEWT